MPNVERARAPVDRAGSDRLLQLHNLPWEQMCIHMAPHTIVPGGTDACYQSCGQQDSRNPTGILPVTKRSLRDNLSISPISTKSLSLKLNSNNSSFHAGFELSIQGTLRNLLLSHFTKF